MLDAIELVGAEWRVPAHSAWCGAGTRSSAIEAVILGCRAGLCAALVRAWNFIPPAIRDPEGAPLEVRVRSGGREVGLVVGRTARGSYLETHPILVVGDGPIRVEVVGEPERSVEIPSCLGGPPPSPFILPLGTDLGGVEREWRVEEGLGGAIEVAQWAAPGGRVLLARCRLDPGAWPDGVHVRLTALGEEEEPEALLRALGERTEAAILVAPSSGWTVVVPELVIAFTSPLGP